jgi:myo-inositol-1(or 4)-monophosphatase
MSDLALALEIAIEAGELLLSYFGRAQLEYKGENNLVTDADRASEELIVRRLTAAHPHDAVIAEEGSFVIGDNHRRWYVDPLDGTNNFAHGFWAYAVSIGLVENGELKVGVVHAPALGQTFSALRGNGATLNGSPIAVSQTARMADALCSTGFPYARRTLKRNNLAEHARVVMSAQGIRRVGSAALDLCWVACGRWDGYWEFHLSPWDVAAGMLVCREAGGVVTDLMGKPVNLEQPEIVAANPALHPQLLSVLNIG